MWKDAIKTELHAINQKKKWSSVTKIPGHKMIGTKIRAMCFGPVRYRPSRWKTFVDLLDAVCRRYAY
uniref:Uncharacterized protein n=1 Tax=Hyaloperonospora arabidopsidis (strain Emoy2) TaxID=559515 RepID=M4BB65_HYAAE